MSNRTDSLEVKKQYLILQGRLLRSQLSYQIEFTRANRAVGRMARLQKGVDWLSDKPLAWVGLGLGLLLMLSHPKKFIRLFSRGWLLWHALKRFRPLVNYALSYWRYTKGRS